MAKIVEMPKLSPTMEEGQLSAWHKREGDAVDVDDLLAEVETDKATMEFRSFDKGVLLKLLVQDGDVVQLGQPVAIMGEQGEDITALLEQVKGGSSGEAAAGQAPSKPAPEASAPKEPVAPADTSSNDGPKGGATPASSDASLSEPGRVRASPYVRKLAREREIDLQTMQGSGPGGRIVARDLEGATSSAAARPSAGSPGPVRPDERRPLSMMRKTIARRLTESKQTVPHFYLTIDVDAGALVALRQQVNRDLAASAKPDEKPPKVSFNDLVIKACAIALRDVPECNATFTEKELILHGRVDISVAVAVPDGLVTPVVRSADQKTVMQIASEVRELAGRARDKKLRPEEMSGGTFSISNLGMFDIDAFSAVINPPEGAILAVGRIREEPVVRDGAVVAGHKLAMTLSCDHRVIDGAVGATYLRALRGLLEHPFQILIR